MRPDIAPPSSPAWRDTQLSGFQLCIGATEPERRIVRDDAAKPYQTQLIDGYLSREVQFGR